MDYLFPLRDVLRICGIFSLAQSASLSAAASGRMRCMHIQCPWRLEGPTGLVTGFSDLWEPTDHSASIDWETWSYDTHDNVQDMALYHLLGGDDPSTRSAVNRTPWLVVEAVAADAYGSVHLELTGHYRLVIFPAGTHGEHWRLFQPHSDAPHLVCEGMTVTLHHADEA
jgi:hypothetical protein